MYKSIFFISLHFLYSFLNAQSNKGVFKIKGRITNADSSFVFLYYYDSARFIKDSCYILNNKFSFKGYIQEPQKIFFSRFPIEQKNNISTSKEFYIEPNLMELNVNATDFEKIKVIGSKTDSERIKLENLKNNLKKKIQSLTTAYTQIILERNNKKYNTQNKTEIKELTKQLDSIHNLLKPLYNLESKIDSVFILNNPKSFVSADLFFEAIQFSNIHFQNPEDIFSKFPFKIKESFIGQKIKRELAKKDFIPIGSSAKNFIAIDIKNDTITLEKYKNRKYILLDFGASWCIPCKELIPVLSRIVNKWNEKLEIINISIDDNEKLWLSSLNNRDEKLKYILNKKDGRVNNFLGNSIIDIYGIQGIPTLILINEKLEVVKKFGTGLSFFPISSLEGEIQNILE